MPVNDNLKWVYNQLTQKGANMGTIEDFEKAMGDEANRKWAYDYAGKQGINLGSMDDFTNAIAPVPVQQQYPQEVIDAYNDPNNAAPNFKDIAQINKEYQQRNAAKANNDTLPPMAPSAEQDTLMTDSIWGQPTQQQAQKADSTNTQVPMRPTNELPFNGVSIEEMRRAQQQPEGYEPEQGVGGRPWTMQQEAAWSSLTPSARRAAIGDDKLANQFEEYLKNQQRDELRSKNRYQVESLSQELDSLMNERAKAFDKEHTPLEQAMYASMNEGRSYLDTDKEYQTLSAAKRSLNDAQKIIDEADIAMKEGRYDEWYKQLGQFFQGAGRGFKNGTFDIRTWDFGGTDISDGSALLTALNKADKGEKLTRSQQALLDAKAIEMATQAYFGSELG